MIKYTNKRPWLWAVYMLAIVLPIILFIAFCCVTPNKKPDEAADRKKTDAPSPDDEEDRKFGITGDEPDPLVREEDTEGAEGAAEEEEVQEGEEEEEEDEEEAKEDSPASN